MINPYLYIREATKNGESLLALCCGIGMELRYIRSQDVTAVDIVPQYLAKVYKYCPQAKTVCSDSLAYVKEQPANSVDVISLIDGIEHMAKETGLQIIEQMKRVCRKKILLFTPEGYLRNEPHNAWGIKGADEFQTHKSGWEVEELCGLDFKLIVRYPGITQHDEPYFALMFIYEK